MPAPALVIRDPRPGDEAAWRLLWSGYVTFYEAEVSEAVTSATWQRLFMPGSAMFGRLAEWDGAVAGFTISVVHLGSWTLSPVCYLEDLFVKPSLRGHGVGKGLLMHLARLAVARGCGRVEWSVLDWNEPAIRFYESLGARPMAGWTIFRVTGEALARLGASFDTPLTRV